MDFLGSAITAGAGGEWLTNGTEPTLAAAKLGIGQGLITNFRTLACLHTSDEDPGPALDLDYDFAGLWMILA